MNNLIIAIISNILLLMVNITEKVIHILGKILFISWVILFNTMASAMIAFVAYGILIHIILAITLVILLILTLIALLSIDYVFGYEYLEYISELRPNIKISGEGKNPGLMVFHVIWFYTFFLTIPMTLREHGIIKEK